MKQPVIFWFPASEDTLILARHLVGGFGFIAVSGGDNVKDGENVRLERSWHKTTSAG